MCHNAHESYVMFIHIYKYIYIKKLSNHAFNFSYDMIETRILEKNNVERICLSSLTYPILLRTQERKSQNECKCVLRRRKIITGKN